GAGGDRAAPPGAGGELLAAGAGGRAPLRSPRLRRRLRAELCPPPRLLVGPRRHRPRRASPPRRPPRLVAPPRHLDSVPGRDDLVHGEARGGRRGAPQAAPP